MDLRKHGREHAVPAMQHGLPQCSKPHVLQHEPIQVQEDLNTDFLNSPLDQFEIRDLLNIGAPVLGNIGISLTNISLYVLIAQMLIIVFTVLANNRKVISSY